MMLECRDLVVEYPCGDQVVRPIDGLTMDVSSGDLAVLLGASGESQAHTPPIEFTLSPYSFPFSDNTLLPSGNRFGIYLTRIDDIPDVARIMRLSFVWFPKDFVPPRERPFDLDVETPPVVAAPPSSVEPDRRSDEGDGT